MNFCYFLINNNPNHKNISLYILQLITQIFVHRLKLSLNNFD